MARASAFLLSAPLLLNLPAFAAYQPPRWVASPVSPKTAPIRTTRKARVRTQQADCSCNCSCNQFGCTPCTGSCTFSSGFTYSCTFSSDASCALASGSCTVSGSLDGVSCSGSINVVSGSGNLSCSFNGCNISESVSDFVPNISTHGCGLQTGPYAAVVASPVTGVSAGVNGFGQYNLLAPEAGRPLFNQHYSTEFEEWYQQVLAQAQSQSHLALFLTFSGEPPSEQAAAFSQQYAQAAATELAAPPPGPACPDDPAIVCLLGTTRQTPNPELLGQTAAPQAVVSAPPPSAEPEVPEPDEQSADAEVEGGESVLSEGWDALTKATTYEEIARLTAKLGAEGLEKLGVDVADLSHMTPEQFEKLDKASESVGNVATAIGAIDAVTTSDGTVAAGKSTGLVLGMVSEPAGLATAACGLSNACSQAAADATNAALNAPINAVSNSWVGQTAAYSGSLDQYYQLTAATPQAGQQAYQAQQQATVNQMMHNGQGDVTTFIFGVLGHDSPGEKK